MTSPGLFGSLLKKRRLDMGLTMEQMAGKIRTTKGYISGVENGHIPPFGPKKIPRAALVLGVDVEMAQMLAWADKAPKLIRSQVQAMTLKWIRGRPITVTPAMAKKMLKENAKAMCHIRPVDEELVRQLSAQMKSTWNSK